MTQTPPNEREMKAEKLAYFNGICSQITESVFLGSDTVARNLQSNRRAVTPRNAPYRPVAACNAHP